MQPLLRRQLKRVGLDPESPPADAAAWREFLERVDRAYAELESERYTRERSMELVTAEMQDLYATVRLEHERLQELVACLGVGLVSLDASARARMVNPDATHVTGWSQADLEGRDVFEAIRAQGPDGTPLALGVVLRSGAASRSTDATFLRKDGTRVPVAFVLNSVEREGEVLGAYLVFSDIRQRKEAEAGLRRARELAELADRTKTEFVATMSHELGTPLNGVIGMLELLEGTALDDGQRDCVRTARASAGSLAAIVQDVLDFSKLEAGQLVLELGPADLRTLVGDTLAGPREEAARKGLAFELDWRAGDPPALLVDARRLSQVLHNLAANAVKFTERGGVTVTVERAGEDDATVAYRFSVRDSGPGIREELQSRLFTGFWQQDGSFARRHGGTGLGLAICKRLVEAMEGRIGVTSAAGEGATFWFQVALPREQQAPAALAVAPPIEPLHCDGARVLVVEDTPVNQKITTRLLERLGCDVTLAGDGREAVVAFTRESYELVLMDCQMPGMDGLEATRLLRRHEAGSAGRRVPIVALTANGTVADRDRCFAAGMDDFVTKPLQAITLERVLRRWLPGVAA